MNLKELIRGTWYIPSPRHNETASLFNRWRISMSIIEGPIRLSSEGYDEIDMTWVDMRFDGEQWQPDVQETCPNDYMLDDVTGDSSADWPRGGP